MQNFTDGERLREEEERIEEVIVCCGEGMANVPFQRWKKDEKAQGDCGPESETCTVVGQEPCSS